MFRFLIVVCLVIGVVPAAAAAPLRVVATLPGLAALAREVGGPAVEVTALTSPRQDPHHVDARPNLVLALNRADLVIENGLQLEIGWLPVLLKQARNPKILPGAAGHLDASRHARLLQVPTGRIDRAQGDIHPGGNPHFLVDPRNGARVAEAIGQALARLDPERAEQHRRNGAQVAARLQAQAAAEARRFAALPAEKRRVVAYHDSLPYLVDWLGLQQVATVEPKPGIPPHPQHVAAVLQTMRDTATRVVAQEEFYPRNTSQTLARLAGARLVVLPGGPDGAQGYGAWLQALARELHDALDK